MKHVPRAEIFVSVGFVALVSSVALIQGGVELQHGRRPRALQVFARAPTTENLRTYEADLEDASVVAATLRPWMQYAQFVIFKAGGEKAFVGRDGWVFYRPAVQYLTERTPSPPPTAAEVTPLAAILSFRDQLAARGIRLLVVPIPNKGSIYPEMLTGRADRGSVVVCRQSQELLDGLKASGVEVVDLFAAFRRAKQRPDNDNPDPLYLKQDTHWSPAGLAVAAVAVAERVKERGWARPGAVRYRQKPVRLERVGDLLEMLRVPQIERHAGPEKILCRQVLRDQTGALYEDTPDAEILILGDSFLRVYERDEPQAAGFIAHLARELGQPLTSIVNDGGASTLVRQELYRRGELLANKKLVIWEFVERDLRFGTDGWQIVPLPPTVKKSSRLRDSLDIWLLSLPSPGISAEPGHQDHDGRVGRKKIRVESRNQADTQTLWTSGLHLFRVPESRPNLAIKTTMVVWDARGFGPAPGVSANWQRGALRARQVIAMLRRGSSIATCHRVAHGIESHHHAGRLRRQVE